MIDFSGPSKITGIRRAIHEVQCGASAQRAVDEALEAMAAHLVRVMVYRLALELTDKFAGVPFATGGVIGGLPDA